MSNGVGRTVSWLVKCPEKRLHHHGRWTAANEAVATQNLLHIPLGIDEMTNEFKYSSA